MEQTLSDPGAGVRRLREEGERPTAHIIMGSVDGGYQCQIKVTDHSYRTSLALGYLYLGVPVATLLLVEPYCLRQPSHWETDMKERRDHSSNGRFSHPDLRILTPGFDGVGITMQVGA